MNTVYSIIATTLMVLLMVYGIVLIGNQAIINTNLDDDSLQIIALYDNQLSSLETDFNGNYNNSKDNINFEPDSNLIGDEVKEYFASKSQIDEFRDALNMFYKIPDLLFISIPIIDQEDLTIYRNVTWFMVFISIALAIYVAVRSGKVKEDL